MSPGTPPPAEARRRGSGNEAATRDVLQAVDALVSQEASRQYAMDRAGLAAPAVRGKRLRARIAISVAGPGLTDAQVRSLTAGCAAVELLHLGTLVQDDVIDASTERRGLPSVWTEHGTSRAIVSADAAYGTAFRLASQVGETFVSHLAGAMEALCDGQMAELDQCGNVARTADEVEVVALAKTGALFGSAAFLGAIHRRGEREEVSKEAVTLGMAYQLLDDLEDVDETQPDCGDDLSSGLLTHPWIYASGELDLESALGRAGTPKDTDDDGRDQDDRRDLVSSLWRTQGPGRASDRIHEVLEPLTGKEAFGSDRPLAPFAQAFTEKAASIVRRNTGGSGRP